MRKNSTGPVLAILDVLLMLTISDILLRAVYRPKICCDFNWGRFNNSLSVT